MLPYGGKERVAGDRGGKQRAPYAQAARYFRDAARGLCVVVFRSGDCLICVVQSCLTTFAHRHTKDRLTHKRDVRHQCVSRRLPCSTSSPLRAFVRHSCAHRRTHTFAIARRNPQACTRHTHIFSPIASQRLSLSLDFPLSLSLSVCLSLWLMLAFSRSFARPLPKTHSRYPPMNIRNIII